MPFSSRRIDPPPVSDLAVSVEQLQVSLRQASPQQLAANTNSTYIETGADAGEFRLRFFNDLLVIPYPEWVVYSSSTEPCSLPVQALLLYHFQTSNGIPLSGKWVSFAELPGGRIYSQAFQGYSGDRLSGLCGNQIDLFRQACLEALGQPEGVGDAAFSFFALPRVPLLVTYWLGEDEFPPFCKVLFDSTAVNSLPIDVCAILGKMLISRIARYVQQKC